jgi:2-dehydro-3-deoxyphosphooctonate aldolase (KDO 8-P synthase)
METHPDPRHAKSDGSNSMPIDKMSNLLRSLKEIDRVTKNNGFIEDTIND